MYSYVSLFDFSEQIGHSYFFGGELKFFAITFNTSINPYTITIKDLAILGEWKKKFRIKVLVQLYVYLLLKNQVLARPRKKL